MRRVRLMGRPAESHLRTSALAWRTMYWSSRPFVTRRVTAHDVDGRSREQIMTALADEGLGPDATVEGRGFVTSTLAVAAPVAATVAWLLLSAVALVLRETGHGTILGPLPLIGWLFVLPVYGLGLSWSWRFWWARRQLTAWTARGEPEHERPIERSLPRGRDTVVGLLLGGVADVLMILQVACESVVSGWDGLPQGCSLAATRMESPRSMGAPHE